jgi:hypothetical protein
MPNHVTNILTITGNEESVARVMNEISGAYDDGEIMFIDFNKIIPRPDSLDITSGSGTDNGIAVLQYLAGNTKRIDEMLSWNWVTEAGITTSEDLVKYMLENKTADIDSAKIALDNIKNYGHKDWYSWSVDKWGTKWNAYDQVSNDDGSITFQTAWSTPYPVMEALSRKYPEAVICVRYADEDFGHNVGEYTLMEGDVIEQNTPEGGSDEAYELAANITGYEDYFTDRVYDIEAEDVDDLEPYEIDHIRYVYDKGILDDFPKVVLEVMEQMAIDDEDYEFAERIKNTIPDNED